MVGLTVVVDLVDAVVVLVISNVVVVVVVVANGVVAVDGNSVVVVVVGRVVNLTVELLRGGFSVVASNDFLQVTIRSNK